MTDEPQPGHLRPDRVLTNVFRGVVRDMLSDNHGAVKAGTNDALLRFLEDVDEETLEYNLKQNDMADLTELERHVRANQSADFPTDRGDNE